MALRTLTALSAADSKELSKLMPQLAQLFGSKGTALGGSSAERLERARLLCVLLGRFCGCVKPQLKDDSPEFAVVWQLCQQAIQVVMEAFSRGNVPPEWFGALQAVMDLSFDLAAYAREKRPAGVGCPDKHWERI